MFYWSYKYFSVLFLLLSLLLDFEFFLLFLNLIILHLIYGFLSILKDYIHQNEIKLFSIFLGRLMFLIMLNILIEAIL